MMNRFLTLGRYSSLYIVTTLRTTLPTITPLLYAPFSSLTRPVRPGERPILVTCNTRGIAEAYSSVEPSNNNNSNEIDTKIPFSQLGLQPELVHSLKGLGFETAFDIQAQTLPHTLKGRNVIGRAITGSGKTLAYALPIVHALTANSNERGIPRGLVITPTRELCRQVTECIGNLGMGLRCVALYGGDSYYRQERELRQGIDVVCATPGRLNDHIQRGTLSINKMKFLVLDEADELLNPNFKDQIEHVLENVPPTKQMMLFSATMPHDVKMLVQRYMPNPEIVNLTSSAKMVPASISHSVIRIDPYNRFGVILDLLRVHSPERCIVFTTTKIEARELGSYLCRHGIRASSLHSDLSQSIRESCLHKFRLGSIKVIAATDVAARGIDIPEIDLVIQVEPPPSGVDFYIHRSGRTGRKGLPGKCILLASPSRACNDFLRDLRRFVKVEEGSLPSREAITKLCLDNAVESIRNSKKSSKLTSLAQPYAEELYASMGIDALTNALVIMADARETSKDYKRETTSYGERSYGERGYGERSYGERSYDRSERFGDRNRVRGRGYDGRYRDSNRHYRGRERDSGRRGYNNRRNYQESFEEDLFSSDTKWDFDTQ